MSQFYLKACYLRIIFFCLLIGISSGGLCQAETYQQHYDNGNIKLEADLVDGKYEGIVKWYREDGSLFREGEYSNGRENGIFKEYYPSGKLNFKGEMKDGMWDGVVNYYFEDGSVKLKYLYDNQRYAGYYYGPNYINSPEQFVALYTLLGRAGEEVILKADYNPQDLSVANTLFYPQNVSSEPLHKIEFLSKEGAVVSIEFFYKGDFVKNLKIDTDFRPALGSKNLEKKFTLVSKDDKEIYFTFSWKKDGILKNVYVDPKEHPFK